MITRKLLNFQVTDFVAVRVINKRLQGIRHITLEQSCGENGMRIGVQMRKGSR